MNFDKPGVPQTVKVLTQTVPSFMKGTRFANPKSMILQYPSMPMRTFSGCQREGMVTARKAGNEKMTRKKTIDFQEKLNHCAAAISDHTFRSL